MTFTHVDSRSLNGESHRGNAIAALLLLQVAVSPCPFAQMNAHPTDLNQASHEAFVASFAGCYDLELGRWWPWAFGEDTVFVTPLRHIRLLTERGTQGWGKDEFLIRNLPGAKGKKPHRGGAAFWQIYANSRIDLIWTDGFTGVTVTLDKAGSKLDGWAHPHFDGPMLIPRIAHATARRVACEATP